MEWRTLMNWERLRGASDKKCGVRHPALRDVDRITFSSAFRRLQDKTQVFPLPESDFVRTRLTHSIESSCVARSLGTIVGERVISEHELDRQCGLAPIDFGVAVSAACLAHDIGNPPFGHSGEDAIQYWFHTSDLAQELLNQIDDRQRCDFLKFEGNAQGFRILTRTENPQREGGLRLTYCTLAAFTKYPRESDLPMEGPFAGVSAKKHGFFQREAEYFEEVANCVGLIRNEGSMRRWSRHPLAFLVEAADDICYHIIDFEDGYKLGRVSFDDIFNYLTKIVQNEYDLAETKTIREESERVAFLRSKAINSLIHQVADAFIKNEGDILQGKFDKSLLSHTSSASVLKDISDKSRKNVYNSPCVIEIEAAGFDVVGGLLESFIGAATDCSKHGKKATARSRKYLELLPDRFGKVEDDPYKRLLRITDYVSGMTDSFAVSLYKKLKGISIPSA